MLNYKKSFFGVAIILIMTVIAGMLIIIKTTHKETIHPDPIVLESDSDISEVRDTTEYNKVKIEFLSDISDFKSLDKMEITDLKTVDYIDSTIRSSQMPTKESDLENNHTKQYSIKLSNNMGGYSCRLYYDTLYDKAYLMRDGDLYEVGTDFARYIDSFLEHTNITIPIDDANVVELFQTYGWTLDYQINVIKSQLDHINVLSDFTPNPYYFAYNNELSKDIDLNMSGYSNSSNINVEIYRIHESMPDEFYPIQDCRGVVVKKDTKIIGAFINAGRHSTFNACSLKGNNFEKAAGQTLYEWFEKMIDANSIEDSLAKLEPEQVIEEYFMALDNKDITNAAYCIAKETLLGNLTSNMPNKDLFNEEVYLPLTDAKLLKAELSDETNKKTKIFNITVDLQYNKEDTKILIDSGEQSWYCTMVYESPQTGWKIAGFGH